MAETAYEFFMRGHNGSGGLHLFNPPEPHATPTRGTRYNRNLQGGSPCGTCLSMPMYWKIKAPKLKGGPNIELANRWSGEFIVRKRQWIPSVVFPGNVCHFAQILTPKESWDKDYPWEEQATWSMIQGVSIADLRPPSGWWLFAWPAGEHEGFFVEDVAAAFHIGNSGTTPATIKSRRFGCRDVNLFQVFNGDGSGTHPYRDDHLYVTAEPYWP